MPSLPPDLTRRAKTVIALLVDAEPRPANHGPGWVVTVERRIRTERWTEVCEAVAAQPSLDADTIAAQLAPAPAASPPTGGFTQTEPTPPSLEPWTGPELDPEAGPYVDDPTEKLTAARRALANTRKPPPGPKPIATRGAVA